MKRHLRTGVRVAAVVLRRRVTRSAAELAYFLILTFFPLLVCINAAAGALNLRESDFYRLLAQVVPAQSLAVVEDYLAYITQNRSPALLIGGVILTITSSSAAFRSLLATVDDIYRRPHQSGIWFGVKSVLLSGLLLATVVVGMVILVTGEWFIALLDRLFQVGALLESWTRLRFPLLFVFLLLMLMPFLIAISYREYFFPLYAAEVGITEADIGRIYLLCGLLVIYLGPVLTKTLIGLLGGKWTVVLASGLMIGATLLFAFVPTMPAALVGVLLLSVAISFGYAAQSSYYAGIPRVQQYGGSRSMGVYSLFDNSGQTLGPVVYGVALMFGYQRGILAIGGGLLVLLVLFLVVNLGGGKAPSKSKEETSHAGV